MSEPLDIAGQKFGRLTALEPVNTPYRDSRRSLLWLCRCECGRKREVGVASLRSGNTRSCGCLQREAQGTREEARRRKQMSWLKHRAWSLGLPPPPPLREKP